MHNLFTHKNLSEADELRGILQDITPWLIEKLKITSIADVLIIKNSQALPIPITNVIMQQWIGKDIRVKNHSDSMKPAFEALMSRVKTGECHPSSLTTFRFNNNKGEEDLIQSTSFGQAENCIHATLDKIPFVYLSISRYKSMGCDGADLDEIYLIPKKHATKFIATVNEIAELVAHSSWLYTYDSENVRSTPINHYRWEDLVLEDSIVSLLKNDFENFFKRKEWFLKNHLPYRRGYLLHGPPGNGKTSILKAMMSSQKLNAYTLRFFDPRVQDTHLDSMFAEASENAPNLVLLEDIDRVFPIDGNGKCGVSLQQLLNSLDGVATQNGVIVVATANDPLQLDPAILKRPGRFDRQILFPNPSPELRERYFRNKNVEEGSLKKAIAMSSDFSFAKLQESYILAGQRSFERSSETISIADVEYGIQIMKDSGEQVSRATHPVGFVYKRHAPETVEDEDDDYEDDIKLSPEELERELDELVSDLQREVLRKNTGSNSNA